MANPIMVITLSVNPEDEAAFNDFYHHQFLPEMLHEVPDIACIRRYEEHGVGGTLRWYNKQYLTIYELVSERVVSKVDEFFTRPRLKSVMEKFQDWKSKSLRNFTRITYLPRWEHDRKPMDGPFGSRPFFLWSLEMKPEMDSAFQDWYENDYLPLQVADIPTWAGVRRYTSVKREQVRHLTFFEAEDEQGLIRCLTELRSAHRINQNYEWNRRVEPAVSWHDATSFRPIYRRPG